MAYHVFLASPPLPVAPRPQQHRQHTLYNHPAYHPAHHDDNRPAVNNGEKVGEIINHGRALAANPRR